MDKKDKLITKKEATMYKEIFIETEAGNNLLNITEQVREAVKESKVQEGICVVYVPHTTAGVVINSALDELTFVDIVADIRRLVPTRVDFNHIYDTPADAAGHIKSTIIGNSLSMIVKDGELLLGGSQSVLFFEFDGPRKRSVYLRIMSE